MDDLRRILERHPLFEGLAAEHLELLVGCARNVRYDAGTVLLREGKPADRFFLVRSGTVALEIHAPGREPLLVDTLHAGDVLGWSWLFPPYRWHADGRAVEPVRALALDGACLRGKCDEDPVLGYELMQRFARIVIDRLQATRLQLLDVYGHVAHA